MRDLITFGRRKDVDEFIRSVLGEMESFSHRFQGVWIGRDSMFDWITAELSHDRLNGKTGRSLEDRLWTRLRLPKDIGWRLPPTDSVSSSTRLPHDMLDWKHLWARYCEIEFDDEIENPRDPFVIIFRLKPGALSDQQLFTRLEPLLRKSKFLTSVEELPVPRLYARSARPTISSYEGGSQIEVTSSLGKVTSGTLGGFLRDAATGTVYGVSCSHVAEPGDAVTIWDARTGKFEPLGTCRFASSFSPGAGCGSTCYKDPHAISVDCSLIELDDPRVATRRVKGIGDISDLLLATSIPRPVIVSGGSSGVANFEATNFGLWNEFALPNGSCQCFSDLFELAPPPSGILAPKFAAFFSSMVKNGDSGAWVLSDRDDGSYNLCGTVLGGNGTRGYAAFIEHARDQWAATLSPAIALVPV